MAQVHIVLCTYNPNSDFFTAQIRSIINQTFTDWSCAVFDDASDAGCVNFIAATLEQDPRFALHARAEHVGVYHNFERGIRATPMDTDFVFFCDQDDLWHADKIETVLDSFAAKPGAMLVHSDLDLIDEIGNTIGASCFALERRNITDIDCSRLLVNNVVTGCATAFRTAILPKLLPFPRLGDDVLFRHDQWTAIVASMLGDIVTLSQPLVSYRQHGSNVVGATITEGENKGMRPYLAQFGHCHSIFGSLIEAWLPRRSYILAIAEAIQIGRLPATKDAARMVGWVAPLMGPARLFAAAIDRKMRSDPIGSLMLKFSLAELLTQAGLSQKGR